MQSLSSVPVGKPAFVVYLHSGCGHCTHAVSSGELDQVASKTNDPVYLCNLKYNPEIQNKHNITSVPVVHRVGTDGVIEATNETTGEHYKAFMERLETR